MNIDLGYRTEGMCFRKSRYNWTDINGEWLSVNDPCVSDWETLKFAYKDKTYVFITEPTGRECHAYCGDEYVGGFDYRYVQGRVAYNNIGGLFGAYLEARRDSSKEKM